MALTKVVDGEQRPLTAEEEAAIAADEAAEAAKPKRRRALPRLVIVDRMTDAELDTVAGLAGGTPEQKRWHARWMAAVEIQPDDPPTVAAFEAVTGNPTRAAEFLAPENP